MKKNLSRSNTSFIFFCIFILFSFSVHIPLPGNSGITNYIYGRVCLSAGFSSFGLLRLFENPSSLTVYFLTLAFYIISLVLLCFLVKDFFENSKGKMNILSLRMLVLFFLTPFSVAYLISKNVFSMLVAILFLLCLTAFIGILKNKMIFVLISSTLMVLLNPVASLSFLPLITLSVFSEFLDRRKKLSVAFPVICVAETSFSFVMALTSAFRSPESADLMSELYKLLFLCPIIILLYFIFISALTNEKNKKKKTLFLFCLFIPLLSLPLAFVCVNFDLWLCSSIVGDFTLILYFFRKKDDYITDALKKVNNLFDNKTYLYFILLIYLVMLSCLLQNSLGDIGNAIFTKNVF